MKIYLYRKTVILIIAIFITLLLAIAIPAIRFVRFRMASYYERPEASTQEVVLHDSPSPIPARRIKMKFDTPSSDISTTPRSRGAVQNVKPKLVQSLSKIGLGWGNPLYIQLFKDEKELILHVFDDKKGYFIPFRTYKILKMSGNSGPKLKEGDYQCPEGFYEITPQNLNPRSRFHLAFNIGYPNIYDRAKKRTGSAIMVHGSDVSVGCFAMGDAAIEEIYAMVEAALSQSQGKIPIHIFPFYMKKANFDSKNGHKWQNFWQKLNQGYQFFEETRLPPNVDIVDSDYVFNDKW